MEKYGWNLVKINLGGNLRGISKEIPEKNSDGFFEKIVVADFLEGYIDTILSIFFIHIHDVVNSVDSIYPEMSWISPGKLSKYPAGV